MRYGRTKKEEIKVERLNSEHKFLDEAFCILRDHDPKSQTRLQKKLESVGLFFKIEDRLGNKAREIRFQFDWLSEVYPSLPKNIPKPYALISIGGRLGYLMDWMHISPLENPKRWMLPFSPRIVGELSSSIRIIHLSNKAHNDIMANVMIEPDGRIVIIDPALPLPYMSLQGRQNRDREMVRELIKSLEAFANTIRRPEINTMAREIGQAI